SSRGKPALEQFANCRRTAGHALLEASERLLKPASSTPPFARTGRNRCAKFGARSLDPAEEYEDENDDEDQPQAARGIVAPAGAIGPGRLCADENKNQDNQQNGSEHGRLPSFVSRDFSVACTLSSVSTLFSVSYERSG